MNKIMTDAAIACVHAGLMTVSEAADAFGLRQSALWKRCKARGISPLQARQTRIKRTARRAIASEWKLPETKRKVRQPATPHNHD